MLGVLTFLTASALASLISTLPQKRDAFTQQGVSFPLSSVSNLVSRWF